MPGSLALLPPEPPPSDLVKVGGWLLQGPDPFPVLPDGQDAVLQCIVGFGPGASVGIDQVFADGLPVGGEEFSDFAIMILPGADGGGRDGGLPGAAGCCHCPSPVWLPGASEHAHPGAGGMDGELRCGGHATRQHAGGAVDCRSRSTARSSQARSTAHEKLSGADTRTIVRRPAKLGSRTTWS